MISRCVYMYINLVTMCEPVAAYHVSPTAQW